MLAGPGFISARPLTTANSDRKDSIEVWGSVKDFFTGDLLERGLVSVIDEQGMEVISDSIHPKHKVMYGTWGWDVPAEYRFKLPHGGNYKIRFTVDGYKDDPQDLIIPDRKFNKYVTEWNKNYALMKKPKDHTLNGVTVTATRIKMVVKGDTVEYDADAFNLSEGSMLDKLIEAMPGMTLNSDGEIYHNGKKVESLLVNGRDFFNGDPQAALKNLPAYTVKKVQVYRRDDNGAYMIRDSLERENRKKLVVDVKLKKEYSHGWIFNSDLAYGTSGRWQSQLLGMYFTDAFKFYSDLNLNNVGGNMWGTGNGDIYSSAADQGEHIYRSASVRAEYNHHLNLDEEYTLRSSASISHNNDDNRSATSSTTYLTGGDTYSRMRSRSLQSITDFNTRHSFELQKKNYYLYTDYFTLSYNRNRSNGLSRSATFNADPLDSYRGASLDSLYMPVGSQRLEQMLNNSVNDITRTERNSLAMTSTGSIDFRSPIFGNSVNLGYSLYRYSSTGHNYEHYSLNNRQASLNGVPGISAQPNSGVSLTDFRNIYTSSPTHNYNFTLRGNYELEITKQFHINLQYNYEQAYNKNLSDRYRLDSLSGWGEETSHHIGETPSMRDSMLRALDVQNAFHRSKLNRTHHYTVGTNIPLWKDFYIGISANLNDYHSGAWDTRGVSPLADPAERAKGRQHTTASALYLDPQFALRSWQRNDSGRVIYIEAAYNLSHTFRDAETLLLITDNTNPLVVTLTNPSLADPRGHNARFNYSYSNARHVQNYFFSLNYNLTEHSVANTTFYDRSTGVTTYQPRNISGNWNIAPSFALERSVDKTDKVRLRYSMAYTYNHSADYITDTGNGLGTPSRSVVHNHLLNSEVRGTWTPGKHRLSGAVNLTWNNQVSDRTNFTPLHSADIRYSLTYNGPVGWGFEYNADLTLFSRRGYNDASMNDDNLVCNMSLIRRFLKNKALTVQLQVRDLFGQLSNVRNTVNSQGVTETWYNAMPRYFMLHLGYRFNTMGKGKKK